MHRLPPLNRAFIRLLTLTATLAAFAIAAITIGIPTGDVGAQGVATDPSGGQPSVRVAVAQGITADAVDVWFGPQQLVVGLLPGVVETVDIEAGSLYEIGIYPTGVRPEVTAPLAFNRLDVQANVGYSLIGHLGTANEAQLTAHRTPTELSGHDGGCVVAHNALLGPTVDVLINNNIARRALLPGGASQRLLVTEQRVTLSSTATGTTGVVATLDAIDLPNDRCVAAFVVGDVDIPTSLDLVVIDQTVVDKVAGDWNSLLGPSEIRVLNALTGAPTDVIISNRVRTGPTIVGTFSGPYTVAPGRTDIVTSIESVGATDTSTMRSSVDITGSSSTDVVVHRTEQGVPTVTTFLNDLRPLDETEACVVVRHAAAGPPVDVHANWGLEADSLASGTQADRIVVSPGLATIAVTPVGAPVPITDPIEVWATGTGCAVVYLVGDLAMGAVRLIESRYPISPGMRPRIDPNAISIPAGRTTETTLPVTVTNDTVGADLQALPRGDGELADGAAAMDPVTAGDDRLIGIGMSSSLPWLIIALGALALVLIVGFIASRLSNANGTGTDAGELYPETAWDGRARTTAQAAPNPLSMPTTLTPEAQEASMARSAVTPWRDTP